MRPIVLTIAGSDCCAGAGIQADLKAIEAGGGFAATVVTAVTAQNTRGVFRVELLAPDLVGDQLRTVFADLEVAAVKSGMLGDEGVISVVAEAMRRHRPGPYVCDPVLRSTSGRDLLSPAATTPLVRDLFPLAALITPNVPEAEALTGSDIASVDDATRAARRLLETGARAVLVTGGHLEAEPATDVLATREGCIRFEGEFLPGRGIHGAGCTLAAAIATGLARGTELVDAVSAAKRFVTDAIRHSLQVGGGNAVADPFFSLHAGVAPAARLGAGGRSEAER